MQHKCIEPLGESKSDYQIFLDILTRLGLGALFSEGGCTELDWVQTHFRFLGPAEARELEGFSEEGLSRWLLRDPGPRKHPSTLPMVAQGPIKDVPGAHSAAGAVFG